MYLFLFVVRFSKVKTNFTMLQEIELIHCTANHVCLYHIVTLIQLNSTNLIHSMPILYCWPALIYASIFPNRWAAYGIGQVAQ